MRNAILTVTCGLLAALWTFDAFAGRVKVSFSETRTAKVDAVVKIIEGAGHTVTGASKAKTPRAQTEVWFMAGQQEAAKTLAAALEPVEGPVEVAE